MIFHLLVSARSGPFILIIKDIDFLIHTTDGPAKAFSLHEAYEAHINRGFGAEIWDTLKAVTSDLDNPNNKLILESAGVTVHGNDLRTTYDERGQPVKVDA